MKVSEALAILEALDPSHEVTLTIGASKHTKPFEPVPGDQQYITVPYTQPHWVIDHEFWPQRNNITCRTVQ